MNTYTAVNQRNWDGRVAPHMASESYNLAEFRTTRCSLMPLELRELGDVTGKTLLHLQCHFGMDTLSWAERGAIVTGVDFSEQAILQARKLAAEMDIDASFIQSDVYALSEHMNNGHQATGHQITGFDIVYTSYGVLCWLGDLPQWAKIVANALKPGGLFYIIDGHPTGGLFTVDDGGALSLTYPYFNEGPERCESSHSYTGEGEKLEATTTYQWEHSMGEIVNSLVDAGLQIHFLHEFPFASWRQLSIMAQDDDGWWRLPSEQPQIPFTFSLMASRKNQETS